MIRVLHTESSLGWGGQEKRILREILGLSRPAFHPFLVCRPGSRLGSEAEAAGVKVVSLRRRANYDPLAVGQLVNFYGREKIDIVHTHSSADSWIASPAAKISFCRPRVVRTGILSGSFNNRWIDRFLAGIWGRYRLEAVALARKAGFEGIATTEKGVNVPGTDPLAIKRIVAKSGDKLWFSTRNWIYSHPRIGTLYSRVAGRI